MKYLIGFLLVPTIMFCMCTTTRRQDDLIRLSLGGATAGNLSPSSLVEVVDFVPLQTSDESLLRGVNKIEYFNRHYYILDKTGAAVFVFDEAGTFVRRIGSRGNGPDEYPGIADFTIDREGGRIVILSDRQAKAYLYDLCGRYLGLEVLGEILLQNIASDSAGFVLSTNHNVDNMAHDAWLLYRFDKNFALLSCHTKLPKSHFSPFPFGCSPFQVQDGHLCYVDFCTDTIYMFSKRLSATYHIDYPHAMPLAGFQVEEFLKKQSDYDWLKECFLLEDRMILTSVLDKRYHVAVADREGVVLRSGYYAPFLLPRMYRGDGDDIVSPIDVQMYSKVWRPLFPDAPAVVAESNELLMRWRLRR